MNSEQSFSSEYDKLKYASTETVWEGIIIEITGASVIMDLKGRMGRLEVPKRMVITQYELKVGQEVAFLMSYPEVLSEQPNEKYLGALNAYHERMKIIQEETKQRREKEGSESDESQKD
jgi:ABC-type transporter lipoprotein component MlaA